MKFSLKGTSFLIYYFKFCKREEYRSKHYHPAWVDKTPSPLSTEVWQEQTSCFTVHHRSLENKLLFVLISYKMSPSSVGFCSSTGLINWNHSYHYVACVTQKQPLGSGGSIPEYWCIRYYTCLFLDPRWIFTHISTNFFFHHSRKLLQNIYRSTNSPACWQKLLWLLPVMPPTHTLSTHTALLRWDRRW